jgi:hypothetical protein
MKDSNQTDHPFNETIRLTVNQPATTFGIFFKGALRAVSRSQAVLNTGDIKKIIVKMKRVKPDFQKLKEYCVICGYPTDSKYLPVTFPEILFVHPLGMLFTAPEFPLSPIGLIHLTQHITQHHSLPADALFDLDCRMDKLTQSSRGILLDVHLEASIDGVCVWEGVSGFISRNKETRKERTRVKNESKTSSDFIPQISLEVPEDTGRRYAKASGDYNPHHLYPFTAKLLGYKRPIAHGMWSLAASLAFIEQKIHISYPRTIKAAFKRPVFMPGRVSLTYKSSTDGNAVEFLLYDSTTNAPHVVGKIT